MIETERLILRPFIEHDVGFSQAFMQADFMVFSPQGAYSEEGAKARFIELVETYRNLGFGKLAIIEKASSEIIGYCGLEPCIIEGKSEVELGFRLLGKYRGKGYATEAAHAVVKFEESRGNSNIIAFTKPENLQSMKVLIKLGFGKVGQSVVSGMPVVVFRRSL